MGRINTQDSLGRRSHVPALGDCVKEMNYFGSKEAAKRYSVGRPYYHPLIIGKIRDYLGIREKLSKVIDVACGNGMSTVALKGISHFVCGVDCSVELIRLAMRGEGAGYLVGTAENLPFCDSEIEMVTVSSAFHWFGRLEFLDEARRVLKTSGWLIFYDNRFLSEMLENKGFENWMKENYGRRYPTPPRPNPAPLGETEARKEGFGLLGVEEYENTVRFSLVQLVDYLTTHSNIAAKVEKGDEKIEDVRSFLTSELAPFFKTKECSFKFGGEIKYFIRS